MAVPVIAFETAEAIFLFLRRVLSVYNTYKEVITVKDDMVRYYSPKTESPQFHLGEDVYLFVLGTTLVRQMQLNKIASNDDLSWVVAKTISSLHERSMVRHGEKVLYQFLFDLGEQLSIMSPEAFKMVAAYRRALQSPVKLADPFVELIEGKAFNFSALDTELLRILAGPQDFQEIVDACKLAMKVEGFGYAESSFDDTSYTAVAREITQQRNAIHKIRLCINTVLLGCETNHSKRATATPLLDGKYAISLMPILALPGNPDNLSVPRLDFWHNSYITKEMTNAMSRTLTERAGLMQTEDKSYHDARYVIGRRAEPGEPVTFVLQSAEDDQKGSSAVDVMINTLKGAVVSKATKFLKSGLRSGRRVTTSSVTPSSSAKQD